MTQQDKSFVIRVGVAALAICTLSIIWVFLGALFNPLVDNNKIFEILSPVTNEITGAIIAIVSALVAVSVPQKKEPSE